MRIALFGKYPPIQGGVSLETYGTARALARRGHDVHVITNANEVEFGFRELLWGPDEGLRGSDPTSPRGVTVHDVVGLQGRMHIPWSKPYESMLFGRGLDVVDAHDCDLVVGSYFQPYALAAAHVARATARPLLVRHAGSDIGYLAKHDALRSAYRWLMAEADSVLSFRGAGEIADVLKGLGASATKIHAVPGARLPSFFDARDEAALDVADLGVRAAVWVRGLEIDATLKQRVIALGEKSFDPAIPTIGIYGKVAVSKGAFDLLAALSTLAREGIAFNFLSVSGGTDAMLEKYYRSILDDEPLARRSWILPLVAPWRIPSFLRRCHVVCFLERAFAIGYHGPRVPREVLAVERCLVCSKEIAEKQHFRDSLVNGKNFVLVEDPADVASLAAALRPLLQDPSRALVIGKRGGFLSKFFEARIPSTDPLADAIESVGGAAIASRRASAGAV